MSIDQRPEELEWQLQERAREEQRLGRSPAGASARLLRYRLVSRELQREPEVQLPADFAHGAAARIALIAEQRRKAGTRFELGWFAALLAIYGGCAILAMALYGGDVLAGVASLIPPGLLANPWLLTLLACAGASRLLGGRRRPGAGAQRSS